MIQKIGDSIEQVLDFLKGIPLSTATVKSYENRYQIIHTYCKKSGVAWFSRSEAQAFTDIQMTKYENGLIGQRHFRYLRKAADLLADCMQGKPLIWGNRGSAKKPACECFSNTLAEYETYLSDFLAPRTIKGVISMIRQFLFSLESRGLSSFDLLATDHVKSFMQGMAEKWPNQMSDLAWAMRKFMSFLSENTLSTLNADRYLLRAAPKRKKVLPCFTAQEADAILAAVDITTALGKRDFAILKLAIETGLRGADILSLKLVDIDWRKCEISVIQSKTDEPIKLPLLAGVGNAVADYILHARPESDSPHVFLRTVNPYIRLGITGNGKNIISRYLEKAGIQHEAWDGKTFHAFRRTAGTRYVEAEVPLISVAELLGHKHIDSAKRYISQNDEKMRACCLDITEFASEKEGLV